MIQGKKFPPPPIRVRDFLPGGRGGKFTKYVTPGFKKPPLPLLYPPHGGSTIFGLLFLGHIRCKGAAGYSNDEDKRGGRKG